MLGVGAAVYLAATIRTQELPSLPVAGMSASIGLTFLVGVGGTAVGSDTGGVANVFGSLGLGAAAVRLGWLLWAEPDASDRRDVRGGRAVVTLTGGRG